MGYTLLLISALIHCLFVHLYVRCQLLRLSLYSEKSAAWSYLLTSSSQWMLYLCLLVTKKIGLGHADNTLHTDPAWGPHATNPASLHTVLDGTTALQGALLCFFLWRYIRIVQASYFQLDAVFSFIEMFSCRVAPDFKVHIGLFFTPHLKFCKEIWNV
jgi:hypothetical protein